MSVDIKANKEGHFRLEVYDYKTEKHLGSIDLRKLEPDQLLQLEVIDGEQL